MNDYLINPMLFYWIEFIGNIQTLGLVLTLIFFCIFGVTGIVMYFDDYDDKRFLRLHKTSIIIGIISLILTVVIPSNTTLYKMMIAKNITAQTVEYFNGNVKDTIDYIFDKIKEEQK